MSRFYVFILLFLSSFKAYSIGLNFNDVADQALLRQVTTIEILYALQPHVNWEETQTYRAPSKLDNGNYMCTYQNIMECEQKTQNHFAIKLFNQP